MKRPLCNAPHDSTCHAKNGNECMNGVTMCEHRGLYLRTDHKTETPAEREIFNSGAVRDTVNYRYDLMSPMLHKYCLHEPKQKLIDILLCLHNMQEWNEDMSSNLMVALKIAILKETPGLTNAVMLNLYAQALHEGASKYGERNWEKGIPESNLVNHALHHLFQLDAGDKSENHLTHLVWNVLTIIHFREQKREESQA